MLIPRREYRAFWHRFLHDRTADSIAEAMARIPHANVTMVPFAIEDNAPLHDTAEGEAPAETASEEPHHH